MSKRIFCIMLIFVVLISNIPSLATTKPPNITIKLNGKTLGLHANTHTVNGRILVPITALAKELGATTQWIANTNSVIITLPTKVKNKTIYFKIGQASALVDGIEVKLDAATTIYQNRAFIPLRFVSENFGAKVDWNGKTKTVSITYKMPVQEIPPMLLLPWELQEKQITGSAITTNK